MSTLEEWADAVCAELGITDAVDRSAVVGTVLDLARDVAHGVARPAAPLTTYLVGLAAGRSDDPKARTGELAGRVAAMAERWPEIAAGGR